MACKKKNFDKQITGHVWNKAENTHFSGATVVLREYDNAFEPNSKVIASAVTDTQGSFVISCKLNKNKSYNLYIDGNATVLAPTGAYGNQFVEQVKISTSSSSQNVEFIAATPSYYTYKLIHDLGSDSMYLEGRHQYINFVGSRMYTNQEVQTDELIIASGNWIYKYIRYNNGIALEEIDTIYYPPYQTQLIEVHY